MKTKRFGIGLVMASLLLVMGCGSSTAPASEQTPSAASPEPAEAGGGSEAVTLRLTHVVAETHPTNIAGQMFADELERLSGGAMKVDIYPNAALGPEKDIIEGLINGTIDIGLVPADGGIASFIPEMNVFGVPFLFRDREHAFNVLNGEPGRELLALGDEAGLKALAFWDIGFRHMTANAPIAAPEDMAGLKIRVQDSPVWQEFMKSLNAAPASVAFTELYSAMEQGVIDGQENPITTIFSGKFYETQKYISLTAHTYSPLLMIMSKKTFDGLSDEQKRWVAEATEKPKEQRHVNEENEAGMIETFKENGMTVIEPDREAFAEATKNVSGVLADKVPQELIDAIRSFE